MADELPTADRDALIDVVDEALTPSAEECLVSHQCLFGVTDRVVDALLPHLAVLLDRARQQGRDEQREEYARRSLAARGYPTAPSATENAETGGGA